MPWPAIAAVGAKAAGGAAAKGGLLKGGASASSKGLMTNFLPTKAGGGGGGAKGGLFKKAGQFAQSEKGMGMINTAVNAGKYLAGVIKKKKAMAEMPSLVDVNERALLNNLKRQQRAARTGTSTRAAQAGLMQSQKQMMKQAMKFGGGMRGLAPLAGMYNQGLANIQAQAREEAAGLNPMIMEQTKLIADRQMDLQRLKSAINMQDAEALKGGSGKNLQALLNQNAAQS
jgi:hypothetical protein